MRQLKRFFPFLLISVMLLVHLAIINDYGFTWDFHHHFFAGGWFLGMKPEELEPRPLPYLLPDPRETVKLPYGPFVQIVPTLSWLLFYKTLHILPPDSSYHLPVILAGIAGIAVLYLFIKEAFGRTEGIIAALFLFLTPRFFSDLHNDMKDVPSAGVFALNMWLLWRLYRYHRVPDMILASIGFALAFNTKVNAIFIPIIFAVFLFIQYIQTHVDLLNRIKIISLEGKEKPWNAGSKQNFARLHFLSAIKLMKQINMELKTRQNFRLRPTHHTSIRSYFVRHTSYFLFFSYFLLAPLLAFLLWTLFWGDGVAQIKLMFITFGIGTNNIEVLLNNKIYLSGVNVPWYYAPWYLAITTPLPILLFFLFGCFLCFWMTLKKNHAASLLLLLWCFLPLTRYLSPKTGVLDGIRHFEEVLFPTAAIAALGAVYLGKQLLIRRIKIKRVRQWSITILASCIFLFLAIPLIRYHPFQITYFNELVGGVWGAYGKYDLDYWGGSQKYAISWVNKHIPQNATINIVMAGNVAGIYLRDDLIPKLNATDFLHAEYVIVLNRQSFFNRYVSHYPIGEYIRTHTPIYTIENQGVPLVWIYKN